MNIPIYRDEYEFPPPSGARWLVQWRNSEGVQYPKFGFMIPQSNRGRYTPYVPYAPYPEVSGQVVVYTLLRTYEAGLLDKIDTCPNN